MISCIKKVVSTNIGTTLIKGTAYLHRCLPDQCRPFLKKKVTGTTAQELNSSAWLRLQCIHTFFEYCGFSLTPDKWNTLLQVSIYRPFLSDHLTEIHFLEKKLIC
jgi:hypothetical protein